MLALQQAFLLINRHRECDSKSYSFFALEQLRHRDDGATEAATGYDIEAVGHDNAATGCDVRAASVCRAASPVPRREAALAADREVRSGQREAEQPATGVVGVRARRQRRGSCRRGRTRSAAAIFGKEEA